MNNYRPEVKDISLYKEIANNITNPLEVIREAISNAVDAHSTIIDIDFYRNSDGVFCIKFKDNGDGMDLDDLASFLIWVIQEKV